MDIKISGPFTWLQSVLANPADPMFGLVNLLSATTKIAVDGGNFECTVWAAGRDSFLANFDLSSAIGLFATQGVDFDGYPWFIRLDDDQMSDAVNALLPASEDVSWSEWEFKSYIINDKGVDRKYFGDLGHTLPISKAFELQQAGVVIESVDQYLA